MPQPPEAPEVVNLETEELRYVTTGIFSHHDRHLPPTTNRPSHAQRRRRRPTHTLSTAATALQDESWLATIFSTQCRDEPHNPALRPPLAQVSIAAHFRILNPSTPTPHSSISPLLGLANIALGLPMDTSSDYKPPTNDEAPAHHRQLPHRGWDTEAILYNHIDENVAKVAAQPDTSMVAVIIARDRPLDRAAGADAIASAIVDLNLAPSESFVVIPPMPKTGDPTSRILPHTNLIVCKTAELRDRVMVDPVKAIYHTTRKDGSDGFTFYIMPVYVESSWYVCTYVGLSDRLSRGEFLSALFDKLVGDAVVVKLIQAHHDNVPDVEDIPTAIRALLHWANVQPCQVWLPAAPGRDTMSQRQNAVRLYMPSPSAHPQPTKTFKAHLSNAAFSFLIDLRGTCHTLPALAWRTTADRRVQRVPRPRPLLGRLPNHQLPRLKAIHMNEEELSSTRVATTIGAIHALDDDGFKTMDAAFRSASSLTTPAAELNRKSRPTI
ncbi:hypothetical protein C8F01DRAFT_1376660 [Mycena amicta]|nr:hypothetical protein C8F01DRAFT_1376660 [Mycena amicta]